MLLTKMQTLGNDFLIADCFEDIFNNPEEYSAKVCNRHFGIGADAFIVLLYSKDADLRTEIYDVEGNRIIPTPNALICAAKYATDNDIVNKDIISIDTDNGVKYVALSQDNESYTVNFGLPVITPQLIPVDFTGELFVDKTISVADEAYNATCVSIAGNPCTVIFTDNGEELNELDLKIVAPFIEKHNIFPAGTNVIFANVAARDLLQARCWKKDVGEVIGCDFAAAAAFMAATLKGTAEDKATVELLGGDAKLEISDDDFLYITAKPERVLNIEW